LPLVPSAVVHLASVFIGGSVVLQSSAWVKVWGNTTLINTDIEISINGIFVATAEAPNGHWSARIPPQPVLWHALLRASGRDGAFASTLVNFGHVILCSGQSNMEMPVAPPTPGAFSAANGTAEVEAAGAYTGRISIMSIESPYPLPVGGWNGSYCPGWPPAPSPECAPQPQWNAVVSGITGTVRGFSAVCWYTGKAVYDAVAATGYPAAVGLIVGSVGGSAIEQWLPEGVLGGVCPADSPPCDTQNNLTDSQFYGALILPFAPYTLGGIVWDQGERDVHCYAPATNKTAAYPCMLAALVTTWRTVFESPGAAFTAVQLPSYIGDCDSVSPLQPNGSYYNCVPGVFNMRLAQTVGVAGLENATVIPTYDLSCSFGVAPIDWCVYVRSIYCPLPPTHTDSIHP
jgi:hypothetical protein